MKAMGTLWMLVGIVAMASSALGSTHHVNCDVPGQTITKALKTAQPGDTIRVRGTCKETVTITTDRLTLHGMDNATIQARVGGHPAMCPRASSMLWGCKASKFADSAYKTVLWMVSTGGRVRPLWYATPVYSGVVMTALKPLKPRQSASWGLVRYAAIAMRVFR